MLSIGLNFILVTYIFFLTIREFPFLFRSSVWFRLHRFYSIIELLLLLILLDLIICDFYCVFMKNYIITFPFSTVFDAIIGFEGRFLILICHDVF